MLHYLTLSVGRFAAFLRIRQFRDAPSPALWPGQRRPLHRPVEGRPSSRSTGAVPPRTEALVGLPRNRTYL